MAQPAVERKKRRLSTGGSEGAGGDDGAGDEDEVMVAAAPVLDAERAKTKALTEELERLRREKEEAENVLEADALDALQAEVLAAAGRIQQAAAEKRAEEKQCVVCMDKEKDVALDPCGHRVCAVCC